MIALSWLPAEVPYSAPALLVIFEYSCRFSTAGIGTVHLIAVSSSARTVDANARPIIAIFSLNGSRLRQLDIDASIAPDHRQAFQLVLPQCVLNSRCSRVHLRSSVADLHPLRL